MYILDSYHVRQEHIQWPFVYVVATEFSLLLSSTSGE